MTAIGLYSDPYSDTYSAGGSGGGGVVPARWNPNAPDVAGAEWYGTFARSLGLSSALGRCARIRATTTEDISYLIPMMSVDAVGFVSQRVTVCADVYDLTVTPNIVAPQLWALALPAANASDGGSGVGIGKGWQMAGANGAYATWAAYSRSAAWTNVNEVIPANSDLNIAASFGNTLVYSPESSAPATILFMGGATLYDGDTGLQNQSLTGKRVGRVQVVALVWNQNFNGATIDGVITDTAGNQYTSDSGPISIPAFSGVRRVTFSWYWKPDTHLDWTAQSAANFLGAGGRTFGIQVTQRPFALFTSGFVVGSVGIQFRVLTEARVAVGKQSVPITRSWRTLTLSDPLTRIVGPWAKVAGHAYLIVFYLNNEGGGASVRVLDSSNVVDHETDALTGITSGAINFDIGGAVPTTRPVTDNGAMALLLSTGGGLSQDSQPYATQTNYGVDATSTVRQLVSKETAGTFGAATVLVRSQPDGHGGILQDAPLNVSLRKTSDDSLLSGPASIATTDVPSDGKLHAIEVRLPGGAVLTTGEQVYLELTTASTVAWDTIGMLTRDISQDPSDSEALNGANVGIGSTDDYGVYAGTADLTLDFPYSIREIPPVLVGLASTTGTVPNIPALAGTYRPQTIGFAMLSWTASALGAGFRQYVVKRFDSTTQTSNDGVWNTIANITTEANSYFNDVECPLNVPVLYRVWVIGNPLGSSTQASFDPVQIDADECDFQFSSNWNPDLSFGATDADNTAPPRDFSKLPGSAGLTIHDMYGAKMPAAFRRTETGGDIFSRRLLLAFNDPAVAAGTVFGDRALLDVPLALFHDLTDAGLPYVCVSDGFGRRWFTAPVAAPGSTVAGIISNLDVTFTEIAGPAILTTPTPWTP